MYEDIDEQVAVLVGFDKDQKNTIRPFKMRWNDREYIIREVSHYYRYKDGEKVIHVMSVNDGTNFFELRVDSVNMVWKLGRVSDGQAR